jgi:hypothetical protein
MNIYHNGASYMAKGDTRYDKINELWQTAPLLICTEYDAKVMTKEICDRFGLKSLGGPSMQRKYVTKRIRRVWTTNNPKHGFVTDGYNRLAHDLAHMINRKRHPRFKPHDNTQCKLEYEISRYVVARMLELHHKQVAKEC